MSERPTLTDELAVEVLDQCLLLMVQLTDVTAAANRRPPPLEHDAQMLAVKVFRHLVAVKQIAGGMRMSVPEGRVIQFNDHVSAKVVARAALETLLVFSFVFGDRDKSVQQFRHLAWRLGGLMDRQRYTSLSEDSDKTKAEERGEVERLQKVIAEHPAFARFTDRQKKALLRGDWRLECGWHDLAKGIGLSQPFFRTLYGFLCGHSHSSWASVIQIRQSYPSLAEQASLSVGVIRMSIFPAVLFVEQYCSVFPAAADWLSANEDERQFVQMWASIARGVGQLYEEASS